MSIQFSAETSPNLLLGTTRNHQHHLKPGLRLAFSSWSNVTSRVSTVQEVGDIQKYSKSDNDPKNMFSFFESYHHMIHRHFAVTLVNCCSSSKELQVAHLSTSPLRLYLPRLFHFGTDHFSKSCVVPVSGKQRFEANICMATVLLQRWWLDLEACLAKRVWLLEPTLAVCKVHKKSRCASDLLIIASVTKAVIST